MPRNLIKANRLNFREKLLNARTKYQVAVNKNSSESQILWNRYAAMLAVNTFYITVIGYLRQQNIAAFGNSIYLPIFGIIFCIIWALVTIKGFYWIQFWALTANNIENKYLRDQDELLNGKKLLLNPFIDGDYKRQNPECLLYKTKVACCSYAVIGLIIIFYIAMIFPTNY